MSRPVKKRKTTVEEVKFDEQAREDYLTGFHKRKVERTKRAKEAAAKRLHAEKLEHRKQLRQERKAEIIKHVKDVNDRLHHAEDQFRLRPEDESEDGSLAKADDKQGTTAAAVAVDREDEYIDEDRHTTVIVEEVDISKHGLHGVGDIPELEAEPGSDNVNVADVTKRRAGRGDATGLKKRRDQDSSQRPKKRDTFRYEGEAERKIERLKQRARRRRETN